MKRIFLGTLAGGIVYFMWGAFSWMVLPWHNATLKDLPGEAAILPALRQNIGETGVYCFPGMKDAGRDAQSMKDFEARHRAGPVGWLVYQAQGLEPMPTSTFVKGIVLDLLAALLASLVLAATKVGGYKTRVLLVTAMGLFAGLVSHASQWTWMSLPAGFALNMIADLVAGWLLAGLAMAAIVREKRS